MSKLIDYDMTPKPLLALALLPTDEIHGGEGLADVFPESGARTWAMRNPDGQLFCIVMVSQEAQQGEFGDIAGLLIHEAVHVWQQHLKDIGEVNHGDEQEAYAIQSIAMALIDAYAHQAEPAK